MIVRAKNSQNIERSGLFSIKSMLSATTAVGTGILAAVLLSGGTYALWADASQVNPGTVSSGSLGITVAENFDDTLFSNLLVGEKVRQSFTVTNTGSTVATLRASATASAAFDVRLAAGACPAVALAGTPATTSPTNLGTLAGGATATYCLEVTVATGAQPGNSAPVAATITAGQN